jgi:hypothetical protein
LAWLEIYGSIRSELMEDCFRNEGDSESTNRTGAYWVRVKLNKKIPHMLPMSGRKIKIYYRGI